MSGWAWIQCDLLVKRYRCVPRCSSSGCQSVAGALGQSLISGQRCAAVILRIMRRRTFLMLPAASYAASEDLYKRLLQSMERIETVDTHEHILPEAERTSQPVDFFTLASHYVVDDLSSAGLKPADRELLNNKNAAASEKWRVFEPAWRYARNTGYSEALRIAVRDIYGVGEITGASITRINDAIRSRNKPGLYQQVLKDRCRVRLAVNDEYWQAQPTAVDSRYFVLARKFDNFVTPITPDGLKRLEALAESSITSLTGLKRAMERQFERALKVNMAAVKTTIAYQRDLHFASTTEAEASADFERLARGE